ncbi:MAG: RNA-binding protein [Candidatus Cloacimonetes bacterium HGW-Cloacimonetes-3]|jgi:ribosomal 50S subunit-recycling heat shock protein|nr:MAG: RNA-binding protein [Candidatus Cloacimonetes bacterium HGW-Cloacimonetes-3]
MRLDLLLNKLCLTKTRSIAKNACDKNLVTLVGKPAKASAMVKAGDIIVFRLYGAEHEIKIISIPTGNVAKKDSTQYYEMLRRDELPTSE